MSNEMMKISKQDYEELLHKLGKLHALEAAGVDGWEHYDVALKEWNKQGEIQELFEDFIEFLNDILAEAKVEEPAGRFCGYSISFDEDSVKKELEALRITILNMEE